jgi:pyrrolidone-carboxylate peptidase
VGVSGIATTVTLEQLGNNLGYMRPDNVGYSPECGCCVVGGPETIHSVLDMEVVRQRVKESGLGVAVSTSQDAGRYQLFDFDFAISERVFIVCHAYII